MTAIKNLALFVFVQNLFIIKLSNQEYILLFTQVILKTKSMFYRK